MRPARVVDADQLRALVAALPDSTVAELGDALSKTEKLPTSRSSVQRPLTRMGYSRKQKFLAIERDTSKNWERRKIYGCFLRALDEKRLVFIDESFCKTGGNSRPLLS